MIDTMRTAVLCAALSRLALSPASPADGRNIEGHWVIHYSGGADYVSLQDPSFFDLRLEGDRLAGSGSIA